MAYAAETTVSVENSRAEIERTLRRYKADSFFYAEEIGRHLIGFKMADRLIRFTLTMPRRDDKAFTTYLRGTTEYARTEAESEKKWEQACRQKWRALALVIKAKLEAVEAGISTVENEFLADTMLQDGQTVAETIQPQIAEAYRLGVKAPALMLGMGKSGG